MLVVWGTNDHVIPVEHAEQLRETLPGAEVVLLDGIGHTPHLSQPAYVGERLAAWIRSSPATEPPDGVAWGVGLPTPHA